MSRQNHDQYFTPEWLVTKYLDLAPIKPSGTILEPCVGKGNIIRPLFDYMESHCEGVPYGIITNDIDDRMEANHHYHCNYLLKSDEVIPKVDWIISNPPYTLAHEFVPLAYQKVRKGLVLLLRLTYLEPCKNRRDWLSENPPNQILITRRIKFVGNSTDNVTTAWFCWYKGTNTEIKNPIQFIY